MPLPVDVAPTGGPVGGPSLGLKLLCDAHASNSVPSTEKCSLDTQRRSLASSTTAAKNASATSCSKRRSRFFVNVVASNARWSMRMSKNHLYIKS